MEAIPRHEMATGRYQHLASRAAVVLIAAGGIAWSLVAADGTSEFYQLDRISSLILGGEVIPPESLSPVLARFDSRPSQECGRTTVPHAVIRLYLATSASNGRSPSAPVLLDTAENELRGALTCSPYQPYLWYGLFWVRMVEGRSPESYIPPLQESYVMGPRELWISIYRNSDALPLFDRLDLRTQALVRAEYLSLAKEQANVAAQTFKNSDHPTRSRLLVWVLDLPIDQRRQLAAALDAADVVVDIPGVEYRDGHVILRSQRTAP